MRTTYTHLPHSFRPFVRSMIKLVAICPLLCIATLSLLASFTLWKNGWEVQAKVAPATQPLRATAALAVSTSYVNDNWNLITDNGAPGLSNGDVVRNDNDTIAPGTITATYGTDGFGTVTTPAPGSVAGSATIADAITNTNAGGTVNVLEGTYTENVTITKSLTMRGAQNGVDARGRVASESIIVPATASSATFNIAFNGTITIDGFSFSGGSSATQGCVYTSVGPNNNMQIINNRFSGYSTAAIWLNRGGSDITIDKNVLDGSNLSGGAQAIFLNGPQSYTGLYLTNNDIINNTGRYGLFVDGNHNVTESATRAPSISGNRFDNNLQGMNLGSRSFGVLGTPVLGTYGGFITNNIFNNNAFDGVQGGIQHVLVSGNTFSNNGRNGLALTSFGNTGADRGGQNSTIKGNLFTGNGSGVNGPGAGIFFSGTQGVGLIETNHANLNRIVSNNIGVQYGSSVNAGNNATIDVENNWWGCNFGPGTGGTGCSGTPNGTLVFAGNTGVLDADPWLKLGITAMPTTVSIGGMSTLTADLTINSNSTDTSGSGNIPNGTPVAFAGTNGTVSPTNTTTTNGKATSTYTGTTQGTGSASTTVDMQIVSTTIIVNKLNSTTVVTSSANPSVYGQTVTFTATVTGSGGTPTGTVQFVIDGGAPTSMALDGAGQATFTTNTLTASGSPHSVVANYLGDSTYNTSSGSLSQTVNKDATTTTLTSSQNPSTFGQPVTFTATVTANAPGSGTPTGTVNFTIDGGAPTSVTLNGSGQAIFTTSAIPVSGSPHSVVATYLGDSNFNTSSGSVSQTVNKANTTTAVASSANPSVFGQSVTFTATVTANAPGSGTPTGTVTFVVDGGTPISATLNGSGQATFTTSTLSVGSHTVVASYLGDSNFNTSSGSLSQTVNKANTTTAITADNPDPSAPGQAVLVTYTVTVNAPGAGTPTGNVTVSASTGESCTGTVAAGACTLTFTTAGTRTLTATYAGDANFNTSTSAAASHQVLTALGFSASLGDPLLCTGPGNVLNVTATVTNPNAITVGVDFTATPTVPGQLLVLPGSCTATGQLAGACTATPTQVSFSGNLAAGQTITFTYRVQVADNVTPGTSLCTTSTASLNGAPLTPIQACTTVNCPTAGPGALFPATAEVSDQKAGSVLFYNLYSSSVAAPNAQNTRVSITNTHPALSIAVHLFFVDGATCSIADSLVCLTPNQTASFLASDIDPGTTGYIIAVASNLVTGCPVNFNYLIGDEYVKLSSGHAANLAAESFAALAGGLPACDALSVTALLSFDGVSYNRAPRVLAASNIPSRADGNDTLIVLNRLGGSLAAGAATLGSIFGILYDDAENPLSFTFNAGVCQFRSSLSNNFPRTAPRFEQFIPAGRSGWAKFYSLSDIGLLGAQLNFNANAGTAANAFNQGHNLHKLTLTTAATLTIPIFPPNC